MDVGGGQSWNSDIGAAFASALASGNVLVAVYGGRHTTLRKRRVPTIVPT
jgi:hypothetical protein